VILSAQLLERLDPERMELHFALASCRYEGTLIDRERADAVFGRLRMLLENADAAAPSLLLLAGDQIYADATAGLFDVETRRGRFYDGYREAWTAPNAREVLRRLPVYMMLDDHEVEDDWHPQDPGPDTLRQWGMIAFEEHQLLHSPKTLDLTQLRDQRPQPPYHYEFEAGGFPVFVCDTRTDRSRDHIMGDGQFLALERGLENNKRLGNRPKFVVSPSLVVPFMRHGRPAAPGHATSARSDGWDGFQQSLLRLFGFITEKQIENVVFLSGDAHFSLVTRIWLNGPSRAAIHALSIVGSPMYAPYPFANMQFREFSPSNADAPLNLGNGHAMHYECDAQSVRTGDSFTLVRTQPLGDGWAIGAVHHTANGEAHETTFQLP